MGARYLVTSFPDWPVLAACRPPDEALAILEAGRVVVCSHAALRLGVAPGQRRKEAEAACDRLVVLARDRAGELRAFELVVAALEGFGVEVAIRRPGWAGFPTRGPARRLGGEEGLVTEVARSLEEVLGRAPFDLGPGPALQASGGRIGVGDGPFVATLAADSARIVESDRTAAFLAEHPVDALARGELVEVLHRLGIATLGAFAALDRADVLARFGADGAHAHALASGEDPTTTRSRRRVPTYACEVVLEDPADRVDAAAFVARSLAEQLCSSLERDGRGSSVLFVEAETSEGERLERRWSHDGPWSAALVVERVRWQLEAWLSAPRGRGREGEDLARGITRLRLVGEEPVPATGRQGGLWGRPPGSDERVERVLARIQGILGPEGVCRGVLVGGRDPADQVQLVPFGDPAPAAGRDAQDPWPGRLPSPNPATVFAAPISGALLDANGGIVSVDARGAPSGEPRELVMGATSLEVAAWAGPWPVDERWWNPASRRRRARVQVATADGAAYLLALEQGQWRIEGRYD